MHAYLWANSSHFGTREQLSNYQLQLLKDNWQKLQVGTAGHAGLQRQALEGPL